MNILKELISRFIGREDLKIEMKPPDIVVFYNGRYHIIRYLVAEEVNFGIKELDSDSIVSLVTSFSTVLEKMLPGSEVKIVKLKSDSSKIMRRISNEMMNLRATLDVIEEPHIRKRTEIKLKILEKIYNTIVSGKPIVRVLLVIKLHSHGKTLSSAKSSIEAVSGLVKAVVYNNMGIKLSEADSRVLRRLVGYELGISCDLPKKSIVVESDRIAVFLPVPPTKKPKIEKYEGIPIGIDLETDWPVIIPLEVFMKHVIILGPTGRGKTTLLASIIEGASTLSYMRLFAIDFKGDLARLADNSILKVMTPADYPINIFVKPSFFSRIDWALSVSDVLSSILGVSRDRLVTVLNKVLREDGKFPDIEEIILDKDLSILSPILDLAVNKPNYALINEIVENNALFTLEGYGTAYQNAYGGLLLHIFKSVALRKSGTRLLIIDEAWRISRLMGLSSLIKEGRSRGVGVVLATQNPNDISVEILENCHLLIMFGSPNEDYLASAKKILGLPDEYIKRLSRLGVGEAIILNALDPHPLIVRIRPPISIQK